MTPWLWKAHNEYDSRLSCISIPDGRLDRSEVVGQAYATNVGRGRVAVAISQHNIIVLTHARDLHRRSVRMLWTGPEGRAYYGPAPGVQNCCYVEVGNQWTIQSPNS